MSKLKKVLYYISIVPVVTDVIIGAIKGIIKGVNDVKKQAQDEWDFEQQSKFMASFKNPVSNLEDTKK